MTTWERLCRVCSSPADFNIFAKIPAYLHGGPKEYLNWQRPIYDMLNDTTGLKITQDDGLPTNICAICISYMKHAVTFHDRAVSNAKSLRAVQLLTVTQNQNIEEKEKENLLKKNAENVLNIKNYELLNINRKGICKINKELFSKCWQMPLEPPNTEEIIQFLRYLALQFNINRNQAPNTKAIEYKLQQQQLQQEQQNNIVAGGDIDSSDDADDHITSATAGECLFSYEEKPFEEDDIMETDLLKAAVTEPENCIERKCRACHNRYLFDDSFRRHLDLCAEYNFLLLVEQLNLLLEIRRKKAVSPHEYLRRFIFCIRKTCEWLTKNCDEMFPLPNSGNCRSEGDGCIANNNNNKLKNLQKPQRNPIIKLLQNKEKLRLFKCLQENTEKKGTAKFKLLERNEKMHTVKFRHLEDVAEVNENCNNNNSQTNPLEVFEVQEKMDAVKIKSLENLMEVSQKTENLSGATTSSLRLIQSPPPCSPIQTKLLLRPEPRYMHNIQSPPAKLLPIPNLKLNDANDSLKTNVYAAYCSTCKLYFENVTNFELHNAQNHNNYYTQKEIQQNEQQPLQQAAAVFFTNLNYNQ